MSSELARMLSGNFRIDAHKGRQNCFEISVKQEAAAALRPPVLVFSKLLMDQGQLPLAGAGRYAADISNAATKSEPPTPPPRFTLARLADVVLSSLTSFKASETKRLF